MAKSKTDKTREHEYQIARAASGILSEIYRGEKIEVFEPRKKTVMHDLWHGKKMSARHQRTWNEIFTIFDQALGESVSNGGYGDSPGGAGFGAAIRPRGGVNAAQERLDYLYRSYLKRHEWQLLKELIRDYTFLLQHGRQLRLDWLGLHLDGYSDTAQARAAAAGRIHALLDSLAEFCQF